MTPIEKAETALNQRIERLQASLRDARSETAQRFLFQSLVVGVGIGGALKDYIRAIGQYAQGRHAELKQAQVTLTAEHAEVLKAGTHLLERFKATPTDRALLKEIEAAQKTMEGIQKTLRRGANALQREVAPSLAMIDQLALSIRRLSEADDLPTLKRVTKTFVEDTRDLYRAQPALPAKEIIDAASWETSAQSEIDQATDFYEAYARAGSQALLALELMTLAVSPTPPHTADEAAQRANGSAAERLKEIATRLTTT